MEPASHGVVGLAANESGRAGELPGRALQADPLWEAVIPDSQERLPMLVEMFTALVKTTGVAGGLAEKTSGLEGVALWLPPGKDMGVRAIVRAGFAMPRFVMSLPRSDRKRMMSVLGQTAERRKVLMPEPHWYIPAIGVDPEFQGIGLGSSLLEHGMARADRAGSPIYQETEIGRNVDFYLRLRFEVIEEFTPEGLDIRMWLVARR